MLISTIMSSPHSSPLTLPPITSLPWSTSMVSSASSSSISSSNTPTTAASAPAPAPAPAASFSPPTSPTTTTTIPYNHPIVAAAQLLPTSPPTPPSAIPGLSHRQHSAIHDYSHGHGPMSSSEAILAEKRRRNAGASSRFRERRKQRERELQERVVYLENRVQLLESALRQHDPKHPQLNISSGEQQQQQQHERTTTTSSSGQSDCNLGNRVSQLEDLMTRFRHEKQSDAEKLSALETENHYLKSLLDPSAQD